MQFDLTKFPNRPLSLCEMVTFLAWDEAMTTDELRAFGHPDERARQQVWQAQFEECHKQALVRLKISAGKSKGRQQALADLDPTGLILCVDDTWPEACQQLRRRWLESQQRLSGARTDLARAAEEWRLCALEESFTVLGRVWDQGAPHDQAIEISFTEFRYYRPDWESDSLEPVWKDGKRVGPKLWCDPNSDKAYERGRPKRWFDAKSYYDVHCSRESFLEWFKCRSHEGSVPLAANGADEGSKQQRRNRRKDEKFAKDDLLYNELMVQLAFEENDDFDTLVIAIGEAVGVPIDFTDVVETDRLKDRMRKRRDREAKRA